MIGSEDQELFERCIQAAQDIVLTTHISPDGDALGSEVSLGRYLADRGKSVRIVNTHATSDTLRFIEDPQHPVNVYDPAVHDEVLRRADLVVLVDNSAPDRLGRMEAIMVEVAGHTLCIDHHPARDAPWARNIVDVGSCATAAMIYDLVTAGDYTPDRLSAEAIYVGLATDTGYFRFNSTNPRAHEIAAALLALGVRPARAYQEVYERNSLAYTRLLGHALSDVRLEAEGKFASVRITGELLRRLGAEQVDTSEITTALLAMDGVRVVGLFRELRDGRVKISLRSKGALDVHRLASAFGGGGHRNASGIVLEGGLDEVAERIAERARALVATEG